MSAVLGAVAGLAYAAVYEGTAGNDNIVVDRGGSVAHLEAGNDTFQGAQGLQSDPGDNYGGVDHVYGDDDNDTISTHTYDDQIHGGTGNDQIQGGAGKDGLYGGPDNDNLTGGAGRDVFHPRGGTDTCTGQPKDYRLRLCENVQLVPN